MLIRLWLRHCHHYVACDALSGPEADGAESAAPGSSDSGKIRLQDPAAPSGKTEEERKASELACLQEKVTVSNQRVSRDEFGRYITADFRNGLEWAIAGIRFQVLLTSPGRSVPWYEDDHATSIPGGIEPGETRAVGLQLMMPASTPGDVEAKVVMLDVADAEKRMLIGDVGIAGWDSDPSPPLRCAEPGEGEAPPSIDADALTSLMGKLESCWQTGSLSQEAAATEIDLAFDIGADGRPVPDSARLLAYAGGSEAAARQAFEAARRAILRCGMDGFGTGMSGGVEISFGPEGPRIITD